MAPPFNKGRFPPKPLNKKSVFDRQRAEAEAKRQREAAETAAVYEDFVKSFDDNGQHQQYPQHPHHPHHPGRPSAFAPSQPLLPPPSLTGGGGSGRRHFSMPTSGPAHRSGGPGSLGPASSGPLKKQSGRLAFGDDDDDYDGDDNDNHGDGGHRPPPGTTLSTAGASALDRAAEKAVAKPTIHLASLPPGTSPAAVRALLAPTGLVVDGVRFLPSAAAAGPYDRKSATAIAMLSAETAASDIDAAVSSLQNRYLGYGYYLVLHRHLSSAVALSSSAVASAAAHQQPFGAKPVPITTAAAGGAPSDGSGLSFSGPPSEYGRFPSSYNRGRAIPPPAGTGGPILYVPVRPPGDIKKLRMIHKVVEGVLQHGPEFEALLMTRPEVQRDEQWAWIWDARSEAGVWYRYRLWETVTGYAASTKTKAGQAKAKKYVPLFEGSSAWKVPDRPLAYEFTTGVDDFASDSEYNSSDDSDYDDGPGGPGAAAAEKTDENEAAFLNPLEKAKLAHLLARLPTTLSKLRKGDIARVTAFAITHASRGADEVVDMIVANVEHPLALTAANPHRETDAKDTAGDPAATAADTAEARNTSGAKLIAVYVVSDILSSSATSGIRHAWRYRQLFEAALRRHKTFESLGRLADKLNWGRLRADKWKRSIGLVLGHWEGWSVFPTATHEYFVSTFENPPRAEKDKATAEAEAEAGVTAGATVKKSRWKTVDAVAQAVEAEAEAEGTAPASMDVDAGPGGGGDGDDEDEAAYRSEYTDDEELDLACLDDEDIDGEPMSDIDLDGIPLTAAEIEALGGDVAEISEEGEIASDDDDFDMSGLSAASSDVDMDAGANADTNTQTDQTDQTVQTVQTETGPDASKSIGGFQMSASRVPGSSRKRMRAVDMFADSDGEGE